MQLISMSGKKLISYRKGNIVSGSEAANEVIMIFPDGINGPRVGHEYPVTGSFTSTFDSKPDLDQMAGIFGIRLENGTGDEFHITVSLAKLYNEENSSNRYNFAGTAWIDRKATEDPQAMRDYTKRLAGES